MFGIIFSVVLQLFGNFSKPGDAREGEGEGGGEAAGGLSDTFSCALGALLGLFAVADAVLVAIFTTVYVIFLRTEGPSASVWIPLVALTISAAAYSTGPVGLIYRDATMLAVYFSRLLAITLFCLVWGVSRFFYADGFLGVLKATVGWLLGIPLYVVGVVACGCNIAFLLNRAQRREVARA